MNRAISITPFIGGYVVKFFSREWDETPEFIKVYPELFSPDMLMHIVTWFMDREVPHE